jgi:acetyl coenzyme A synthetase (ADP forming)-like protein
MSMNPLLNPGAAVSLTVPPETSFAARDGSTVRVRAVRPDDEGRLVAFFHLLSESSRSLRFAGALGDWALEQVAHRQATGDGEKGAGLVSLGDQDRILGHAEYVLINPERAEVAFAVADDTQGRGIGTILLGALAQVAVARGVRVFEAEVLPQNHQMLGVFRDSGFAVRTSAAPDAIHLEFPTGLTEDAVTRFEQREWTAAVTAMNAFFRPESVAVIGASRERNTIGGEVLHNLLSYGFRGAVLPVNTQASVVQSIVSYRSVEDIPLDVDLAVIVVPAPFVLEVAGACGRKGVRSLVIISAGFAETGHDGVARQVELLKVCREFGMRLIGPNCMGIINTDDAIRLNATFAPMPPPGGNVAFLSQSGALGLAIMDHASALGLGLSTFVSVGNKADISGNDLISYWEQDTHTDVILLYLESFGNPRTFSRLARRVTRAKPIVAVKSGRSPAGARATSSHTGSLIAASDVTTDALFRHAGVIRTDTLEQMFDVASLLSSQPLPVGRRVAILTNAGGPGILCADTCVAHGLEVPALGSSTVSALAAVLPAEASLHNPVDMIASASASQYEQVIRILGADPEVDALVVIFIPPLVTRPEDVARALVSAGRELAGRKPLLSVFMQARGIPEELRASELRIPSYDFPENAAIALARAASYAQWKARPVDSRPVLPDIQRDRAASIVATALGGGAGWLGPDAVRELLVCYGLPMVEERVASTPGAAAEAAAGLGSAVALKAIATGLMHKADVGAVRLGLLPGEVAQAAEEMAEVVAAAGHAVTGFVVQSMAPRGVEMIVGVVHDAHFGPLVACGAGGTLVELLKDVSLRLAPVSTRDAREMLDELKIRPLLSGYRGSAATDIDALIDAIVRVSALVEERPEIAELDLNPIVVHEHGVIVVDARIRAAQTGRTPLPGTRN